MRRFWWVCFLMCMTILPSVAQINTESVMLMGRNALYYEDYVLSIQRFNMVISAKPYLAEPYFYRGLAKFYLEDYLGADEDCTSAIERNPFLPDNYKLRGLCRIHLKKYEEAIADYKDLLQIEPKDEGALNNLVLCHLKLEEYDEAVSGIDRMIKFWPRKSQLYTLKAQTYFAQADTLAAVACVDKALEVNPYDGQAWSMRAMVAVNDGEYALAEDALNKAILQAPREANYFVNRALVRYYQRNLRGAMDDYDIAIEIDSMNYIGHFNRGLLRAQVGDDNRAVEDFNFVIGIEPDNMIALFNRAMMLNNTGDFEGAIRDINVVLDEYPNFWTGYQLRAELRRKMGDSKGAEMDEFKIVRAQMEQRYGGGKSQKEKQTRKKSDRNINDYHKLVEADEESEQSVMYASEYRGKVQNRKTELVPEKILVLSYYTGGKGLQRKIYNKELEVLNRKGRMMSHLLLTTEEVVLTESRTQRHFVSIHELTMKMEEQPQHAMLYFSRSMDHYLVQDFTKALADIDKSIELDSTNAFAYFLRAQIILKEQELAKMSHVSTLPTQDVAKGYDVQLKLQMALDDCSRVLQMQPDFSGGYYNRGNVYMQMGKWMEAIDEYTQAIQYHADFAEAYYNRGIAYIQSGDIKLGIADLSVAGEKGLYKAYNLIKRYGAQS